MWAIVRVQNVPFAGAYRFAQAIDHAVGEWNIFYFTGDAETLILGADGDTRIRDIGASLWRSRRGQRRSAIFVKWIPKSDHLSTKLSH
jgi:hypothetical protein